MSVKGLAALIGATGVASAVIYYVHKLQDDERKVCITTRAFLILLLLLRFPLFMMVCIPTHELA